MSFSVKVSMGLGFGPRIRHRVNPAVNQCSRIRYRGSVESVPMRATTVRFSDDLWELLETEASTQGISAAQFVRDATLMRLGALSGRRGDRDDALTIEQLAAGALSHRLSWPDAERLAEL